MRFVNLKQIICINPIKYQLYLDVIYMLSYVFLDLECNIFISVGIDKFAEEENRCHCSQAICTEVEKTE